MRQPGFVVALAVGFCLLGVVRGLPQDATLAPAPADTADVLALLDQERPDPAKIARLAADADVAIPATLTVPKRAEAYFQRAEARAQAGRINDAIADAREAFRLGKGLSYERVTSRYEQFVHRRLLEMGDYKAAVPLMMEEIRNFQPHFRGRLFSLYDELGRVYGSGDDMDHAEQLNRDLHALLAESQSWSAEYDPYRPQFQAQIDRADAYLLEARNQFAQAEAVYHRGHQAQAEALARYEEAAKLGGKDFPFREEYERDLELFQFSEGRTKVLQDRALEGEVDIREALLTRLRRVGKYHEETALVVSNLAAALMGEGRYEDAERLTRAALDIYHTVGFRDEMPRVVFNMQQLAQILEARGLPDQAQAVYDQIDRATAGWELARREAVVDEAARIKLLIGTGKAVEAVELATKKLARERARSGDNSTATAVVRGYLASALAKAGRDAEALADFQAAVPILLESSRQEDSDDSLGAGAIADRNRYILESYLGLLARSRSGTDAAADASVGLADRLRGRSVQRALVQASARSAAKDPALGGLARTEQDLSKQLNGAVADLANLLAQPPDQRDDRAAKDIQAKIAKLRTDHAGAQRELARRFPAYARLIDPPPVRIADIRAVLHDDEAMLSFYFGQDMSFIWAIAKSGPVRFKALAITSGELDEKVAKLRAALDPQALTINKIPPFDVALAHGLYERLLQPVEEVWRPARNLIVAANGALGFLPLGLLPTAEIQPAPDPKALFAEYRDVPWLARDHAFSVIPSVSALTALRTTALADNQRQKLIGFGDPYFNEAQAAEAAKAPTAVAAKPPGDKSGKPKLAVAAPAPPARAPDTAVSMTARGAPLARRNELAADDLTAALGNLPRLPDTADELRSIAVALGVDPAKTLKLGQDANERVVKTAKLSGYRIVAFATHGLMADDIDGLDQPALALTAPKVAGIDGNGLLTMEDILTLKLNADWVVLSACNTAAGSGAGAEAASGLGRAFFYAGARALLVTNWSVHSQSARELIADLFRRQAADPKLTRAQALRQAMMGLLDGPGFVDETGKTLFTYAHPLFWAPYSVIGDGGGT
jgi:CHAT domain-containing protein